MPKEQLLAEIAMEQWGLVTTAQARNVGVTAQHMAQMGKAGDLIRLAHGVYRLAGTPIHLHEDLHAAWLALEPGRTATERIADGEVDMVSHRSAALLLELGDLDADTLEFTVPRRRQTRRTDVRLHRAPVGPDDWALVDGLPTAKPRRVIADLAAARIDRGHLAIVVRDAVLKYNLGTDAVASTLARHARGYGVATGDGRGLVTLLLREAGIPRSAVDVAIRGTPDVTARELLHAAAQSSETDPAMARLRGMDLDLLSHISGTQEALRTAMQLNPDVLRDIPVRLRLSPDLLRQISGMQSVLRRTMQMNPDLLGRISGAQEALRIAVQLDPDVLHGISAAIPTRDAISRAADQLGDRYALASGDRSARHLPAGADQEDVDRQDDE